MTDKQLADALWDELAEIGWCDDRNGAEYRRFVESECGVENFARIVKHLQVLANVPFVNAGNPDEH